MKVIIDVVLHHTRFQYFSTFALKIEVHVLFATAFFIHFAGSQAGQRFLMNYLHLKGKDFWYRKVFRTSLQGRFNCNDWGPKEDVSSNAVFIRHKQFMEKLIQMGADGFRFDAAKHIPPGSSKKYS